MLQYILMIERESRPLVVDVAVLDHKEEVALLKAFVLRKGLVDTPKPTEREALTAALKWFVAQVEGADDEDHD